ncbi:MAG: bifunctional folylpolyglutamate synthase/dihydrofolate synthase [Phormidesmis sp. RL_2_1]|nr:bifunctional folylpolyglutamate synthase/dihydrofolate synthase [Phormidesmis sp. RL_2_1]
MESLSELSAQTVEARLQSYARFGVDLGLERIEKLLQTMGNPHHRVPIIHVAGTNGKGSVCAYLAAILKAAGYRTGRYTSPHLVSWTERIWLDGEPISWIDLRASLDIVEKAIEENAIREKAIEENAIEENAIREKAIEEKAIEEKAIEENAIAPNDHIPTQFEVFTALTLQYFASQRVDVAVMEVGLGGRLDATNVFDSPLATVIVSIGRDHWQRLGDTLAQIAGEKAGILKPGVRAIVGPLPQEAHAVVAARAAELQIPLTWVSPAEEISAESLSADGSIFGQETALMYDGIPYPQTLLGNHQRVNSACAIATIQALRAQGWHISDHAIAQGMAQVHWPGRLQAGEWQGHPLLIDGAHNADAARSLRTYLDKTFPHQAITWLMGMLDTKDHAGVFTALLRTGDQLHLVPVPGHLSAEPTQLAKQAQQLCPNLSAVKTHLTLAAGLRSATETVAQNATDHQRPPTVLCGSLYLIGDFYRQFSRQF